MPAVTRIGDNTSGICDIGDDCCPHSRTGTNKIGSPNIFINGKPLHLVTHTGPCNCPHGGTFKSTVGASDVIANGYKVTRIGDETICQNCGMKGKHIVGSPNVFIGSVSSTTGATGMGG